MRDSRDAITFFKMVKEATNKMAMHSFVVSSAPANLLGRNAAPKSLIKDTCSIKRSALSVSTIMRHWDCHDVMTVPLCVGRLSVSTITAALLRTDQRRALFLPPFNFSTSFFS